MVLLDDGSQRLLRPKAVKKGVQALIEDKQPPMTTGSDHEDEDEEEEEDDDDDTDSSDDEVRASSCVFVVPRALATTQLGLRAGSLWSYSWADGAGGQ